MSMRLRTFGPQTRFETQEVGFRLGEAFGFKNERSSGIKQCECVRNAFCNF